MHKSFQVDDLRDLEVAHVVARSRSSRVGHIVAVFSKEDTEMKIAGGLQLWKWVICNCNEDVDCNKDEDPTKVKVAPKMKISTKMRITIQIWKWVIYDCNKDVYCNKGEDPIKMKIATEMKIVTKMRIAVMEMRKLQSQQRCGFQ